MGKTEQLREKVKREWFAKCFVPVLLMAVVVVVAIVAAKKIVRGVG